MKKPHHVSEKECIHLTPDGSYFIYPRGLNIFSGDDSRFWNLDKTIIYGVATLIQVSRLNVLGVVDVERGKKYRVSFDVKLKPDNFGWTETPVLVMAKVGKGGKYVFSEISLTQSDDYKPIPSPESGQAAVEVYVDPSMVDPMLYFGLYEVWSGKWKGGLQIRKVNIDVVG